MFSDFGFTAYLNFTYYKSDRAVTLRCLQILLIMFNFIPFLKANFLFAAFQHTWQKQEWQNL
ncbi:MAG: hypothetical protein COW65_17170 [Cytophagales bacterium CG18_big_fil_WC_8_21_14_2_50_42_9]|nr:MAG: hypothetical protein COW65_17170 [Cytophagales bacterium CG18_big_fil_WC_8_21_14_2_50_42_9]